MKGYKYRCNLERDITTIFQNRLYAPCCEDLNDPAEMKFNDSDFLFFLDGFGNNEKVRLVSEAYQYLKDFVKDQCGIFSLCKNSCNELLWAYYANGHNGYCIEYDIDRIMQTYNYDKDKQQVFCIDVEYKNEFPIFKSKYVSQSDLTEGLKCILGTKSKSWEREEEVRLVFSKYGFVEIDYRTITGIYFGVRMSEEDKMKIMEQLKGRGIIYYQMKFKDDSYLMNYTVIKDQYEGTSKYIANNLPYENVRCIATKKDKDKYKHLINKALEIVSKEPCIKEIRSYYAVSNPYPIISIVTKVNDGIISDCPTRVFIFDVVDNDIFPRFF